MPNLLKLKPKSLHFRKLLCSTPQQLRQKQLFNRKDKLTRKQKVKIKYACPQGTVINFRVNKVARLRLQSFKRVEMRRKNLTKQERLTRSKRANSIKKSICLRNRNSKFAKNL